MSARDELAALILSEFHAGATASSSWRLNPTAAADKILAAGYTKPRTITTAEELDALAEMSVVLSDEGGVFEALEAWNRDESKYGIQWIETGTSWRLESHEIALPATVLYEPAP